MRKVIALVTISVCVLFFVYLQGCGADEAAQGTLVLNEISPWPTDAEVWVEILNPTEDSLPVGGWSIRFLSGASADLPADAPKLPAGGVILVTFGPRAEAPVLKVKTLRIRVPSQAKLNRDGDGCTLYGPDGPTDSITWGTLPKGAAAPLPCGPPLRPQYEVLMEDVPLFRPGDVCLRIPDTWPSLSKKWVSSSLWAFRSADSASTTWSTLPQSAQWLTCSLAVPAFRQRSQLGQ
jgi:hypothetical protein